MIILDDRIILESNECKASAILGQEDIKLQHEHIEKAIRQASRVVYDATSSKAVKLLLDNIDKIKDAVSICPMSWVYNETGYRTAELCWYDTFSNCNKRTNTYGQKLLSILTLHAVIGTQRRLRGASVDIRYRGILSANIELPYDINRIDGYMANIYSECDVTEEIMWDISDELWHCRMFILNYEFDRIMNQGDSGTIRIYKDKHENDDEDIDSILEIFDRYNINASNIRRYNCV